MLENLRKIIDQENTREFEIEAMLEAVEQEIANAFVGDEEDADIPESELNSILNKIPEYDEEEEMNKKLSKLTESYIPESDLLESSEFNKLQFQKYALYNFTFQPFIDIMDYTNRLEKAVIGDLNLVKDMTDIKFVKVKFKWATNVVRKAVGKSLDYRHRETNDVIKKLDNMIKDKESEIKSLTESYITDDNLLAMEEQVGAHLSAIGLIGKESYEDIIEEDKKYLRSRTKENQLDAIINVYIPLRTKWANKALKKYPEEAEKILKYRDKWLQGGEFEKLVEKVRKQIRNRYDI